MLQRSLGEKLRGLEMENSEAAPPPSPPPPPPAPRYKGVRMRKWGKWVAEVRFPNSRQRLWLGSYPTPEMAARAFDAAVYCLRGPTAALNFPDRPPEIPAAETLSRYEILEAATRHAREGWPRSGELEQGARAEEGGGGEVATAGGEGSSAAAAAQQPAVELLPRPCDSIVGEGNDDEDDDDGFWLSPLWNFSE